MSPFQTIAAAIFFTIAVTVGMLLVFRDPLPYSFDNIEHSLSESLHKNGVHWAKVSLDGDQVTISGIAPSQSDLQLARTVVANEGRGVSASFQGIEVKSTVRTSSVSDDLADIQTFREGFEQDNPQGRYQLPSAPTTYAGNDSSGSSGGGAGGGYGSGGTGLSDTNNTPSYAEPAAPTPQHSGLVLSWFLQTPGCSSTSTPPRTTFPIFFRGETAAMLAETLNNLDKLSAFNRDCRCTVSINSQGPTMPADSLNNRRLDEVRYHLMAAGIEPDAILIQ